MKRDMDVVRQMKANHNRTLMMSGYRQCQLCKDEGVSVKDSFKPNCRVCQGCAGHCVCERFDRPGKVIEE
jgi:hypothetical protein